MMRGTELMFEENDSEQHPTGRKTVFTGVEFVPLQYQDLINLKATDQVTVPLSWKNAKVADSSIPEIAIDGFASGNATLKSHYTSKAIGLVRGGWLPSGLALDDDVIVLPDRNIVTELKGHFQSGVKTNESNTDFMDFFAKPGIRINPLLFAIEGNAVSNPTTALVHQQLGEVKVTLQSVLPLARLEPSYNSGLHGNCGFSDILIGIVRDTQAKMTKERSFLMELAPKLHSPTSATKKEECWNQIFVAAKKHGISRRSLVVVAALSAISIPNGKSPAKRVLKLVKNFTDKCAYNALADLRALEIFIGLIAAFPDQPLMLCTKDRNLALFWVGMNISDIELKDGTVGFELSNVDELLPHMTPSQRNSLFSPDC